MRYHNVMPVVNVRWSDARPSASYRLVLKRGTREQSYRSDKPVRDLSGVELVEGNYDFWFTDESSQKSRASARCASSSNKNTARSLSLSEPVEGSVASGDHVLVSGVATARSQVSATAYRLTLDPRGASTTATSVGREERTRSGPPSRSGSALLPSALALAGI